jgi:hypothetical protein
LKKLLTIFGLVAGLSVAASPLSAHHGRGDAYDMQNPITLEGTVTEVRWANPHVVVFMDVENDNGEVVNWGFENSNVSTLARQGYNRRTLRVGQKISAEVNPSRQGAPVGIVVAVILEDGTEIMSRRRGENPVD